ncbi:hypothetical protein LCGC14_1162370 [marine sediment metagenome]|uniref:Uncharacterized protein n=1 Tax=marine sediment metagenome TaxID=412755 RepID=A0A0F9MF99_9ZZZZ
MTEKFCICGENSHHSVYPSEIQKSNGTKSIFGISKEAVKHFCNKCYKERYRNIKMKDLP